MCYVGKMKRIMEMRKLGVLVALSIYTLSLQAQSNFQSRVITDTVYSEFLKTKRAFTVYLPKSFEHNKEKNIRFSIFCTVCGKRMMCGRIADI